MLRLAISELDEGEVPREVAIDEAVALAKRYATADAARLVNGILGRIAARSRQRHSAGGVVTDVRGITPAGRGAARPARGGAGAARGDRGSGEAAIDILAELAEIAKQVEAELTRAKQAADADG